MIREDYKWLTETYIAHRGLFNNVDIPENSIPAFELAVQNGFGIEMDVQASKDGVLMVFHDDTLERMTGIRGRVCDYSFEHLRAMRLGDTQLQIPTFEEFLQAANGTNIVVEIKTHEPIGELEQKVVGALKHYKGNYCVESFNPFIVRWFKQYAPHIIRGQLSCSYEGANMPGYEKRMLANLSLSKWNGSQFIAYDAATIATCKAVKKWAKRVPIICWTVRSQDQYNELCPYFDNMIFDSFVPERRDVVWQGKTAATTAEPELDEEAKKTVAEFTALFRVADGIATEEEIEVELAAETSATPEDVPATEEEPQPETAAAVEAEADAAPNEASAAEEPAEAPTEEAAAEPSEPVATEE